MCDPTSSSQVEKDHIERMEDTGLNLYPQKLQRSYDTNWFYPKGFDELKVISKDLERVSILGGEPTIMPEVIDYMTYLIENDYAKNISLRITTNATNINSTILNLLRQFKKPLVTISVDGIGDVDRYIRYPTNWKKKEENIKNILSVLSDCAIDFCCTYQVLNSLNLEEMVKWYLDLNFPYGILYFNRLFFPEDLQISLLPLEYRLQMADKLEPYLIHKRLKSLNGIVGLLRNAPVPDPELYAKFWSRTEALDNQRSYKFQDALPELYEILSKYR
jgi:glutamate-1-semialdehyde 2,1-aminomutase